MALKVLPHLIFDILEKMPKRQPKLEKLYETLGNALGRNSKPKARAPRSADFASEALVKLQLLDRLANQLMDENAHDKIEQMLSTFISDDFDLERYGNIYSLPIQPTPWRNFLMFHLKDFSEIPDHKTILNLFKNARHLSWVDPLVRKIKIPQGSQEIDELIESIAFRKLYALITEDRLTQDERDKLSASIKDQPADPSNEEVTQKIIWGQRIFEILTNMPAQAEKRRESSRELCALVKTINNERGEIWLQGTA